MKPTLRQLLCTLACCLSAAATAAPVFLEASVTALAAAKVWVHDPLQIDEHSVTFSGPDGSRRVSASVYASRPSWGAEMLVSQDIEATMNGEAAGTVAIRTSMVAHDPVVGEMVFGRSSGWRYRFQADADSILRVGYQVVADPLVQNTNSYAAFNILLRQPGVSSWVRSLDADSAGTLSFGLNAGTVYELVIEAGGDRVSQLTNDFARAFGGMFDWSIEDLPVAQPVPEPSGLLLVLTALAAGAALRGRRR